jgi:GT2 family glycosyltransferase
MAEAWRAHDAEADQAGAAPARCGRDVAWHGGRAVSRWPKLLWKAGIDGRARGSWNRVSFQASGLEPQTMLYVTAFDAQGQAVTKDLFLNALASSRRGHELLCFLPAATSELRLHAIGSAVGTAGAEPPVVQPIGRGPASLRLLMHTPPQALAGLLRQGPLRPGTMLHNLRQLLATSNQDRHTPPQNYASWLSMFDNWAPEDFAPGPDWPSIGILVFARASTSDALAATLSSLEAQWAELRHAVVDPGAGVPLEQAIASLDAEYIGILQAGEVLPPHAGLTAAEQIGQLGRPEIVIADEDEIAADGTRHSPKFKPVPSQVSMLAGTLARGLWLVRRDTLLRHAPAGAAWAEALRMSLWLARHRADARLFSGRIPFLLSHRRFDAEAAPPAVLASVVQDHLRRGGPAIAPVATWPLTFNIHETGRPDPRITVIVPSTLRQPHSLACIQAIMDGTDYAAFDLHVVVMQPGPLDEVQRAARDSLGRHPNLTVATLQADRFNFSAANNHVAARTAGDHILLLNDDVSPIKRDWLRWMAAFMEDPQTGMVGARLLYPDGRVQHGGVIMGLSGLCDHAHRFLPGTDAGYMSRAIVAQELSAVTAACMLVRRSAFERAGGLDESYPSAFNDVDFALRIGEQGHSVVYAPQAELYHHELQTYGSHYSGERSAFQAEEAQRMRERWAGVCAADPFHSPNLGLVSGNEWKLAFPPRRTGEAG